MELNKEQLWKLRTEIKLNSLYYDDYNNSFGIEIHAVCNFFDSFLDFIEGEMEEDIEDFNDSDFFDYLDRYDNEDYLWEWYNCYEYDCFPVDKEIIADRFEDETEDLLYFLVDSEKWAKDSIQERYEDINEVIMNEVASIEEQYPELKNEDDGDLKWYDNARDSLIREFEDR